MARKKRNPPQEEHASEAWLIPYADILTLLLALFIVLFAVSQTDQKKFSEMAVAFSAAFHTGGPDILTGNGNGEVTAAKPSVDTPSQDFVKETAELAEVQKMMDDYIKNNGLGGDLSTDLTQDGLLIRIREKVLFPSGSATLLEQSMQLGKPIASLLGTVKQRVVISGHTDNVPIANSAFPSNWDLSTARALNFMKFLLAQGNLDPARFSTVGYGEYRPVASNDSEEGRAENRRVEILISRQYLQNNQTQQAEDTP